MMRFSKKQIRIGVTGHRILPTYSSVVSRVQQVIQQIELLCVGGGQTPVQLVLLSPLAEGADRLVAKEVLRRPRALLDPPLPLEVDDYMQDFDTQESNDEFRDLLTRAKHKIILDPKATWREAYETVSRYIVDNLMY